MNGQERRKGSKECEDLEKSVKISEDVRGIDKENKKGVKNKKMENRKANGK